MGGLGGFGGLGGMGGADCGCDEEWSLDCYCAEFACPTFEEAVEDPLCVGSGPNEPETVTGCGQVVVRLPAGLQIRTYVYDEDTLELVGAAHMNDLQSGVCNDFGYDGGEAPVECEDADTDALCP